MYLPKIQGREKQMTVHIPIFFYHSILYPGNLEMKPHSFHSFLSSFEGMALLKTKLHDMKNQQVKGLPISNILPNPPDYYMFTSQMCSLHNVHFGQRSKMQLERHTCGLLNLLRRAEVVDSHLKVCFNNFIYPPRVDYFTLGWSLFEYLLSFNSKF